MNTLRIGLLFVASLSFAACVDIGGDVSSRSGSDLCVDVCVAQSRAGCAGFSTSSCVHECEQASAGHAACESQFNSFARCAASARWTCHAGEPSTDSCEGEAFVYFSCASHGSN